MKQTGKTPVHILVSLLKGVRTYLGWGRELRELLDWLDSHPQFIPGELDLAELAAMVEQHGPNIVREQLQRRKRQDDLRDELDIVKHLMGENRETTELRLAMRRNPRYKPLGKMIELASGFGLTLNDMTYMREHAENNEAGRTHVGVYIEAMGRLFAARLIASAYLGEDDELYTFVIRYLEAHRVQPMITLQKALSQLADARHPTVHEVMKELGLDVESAGK